MRFLAVTGARAEGHLRRVAIVELSVPYVLTINEKNRKCAVWNVCDSALPILKVRDLSAAGLIEVDMVVLEQEH